VYVAGSDQDRLRRVARLARLLDAQFRIPGTRIRFGLDALVGLLPAAGDLIMFIASLAIVIEAGRAGSGARPLMRMIINILLDLVVGAIPVLGDIFDVAFKANLRNARLLQRELAKRRT